MLFVKKKWRNYVYMLKYEIIHTKYMIVWAVEHNGININIKLLGFIN